MDADCCWASSVVTELVSLVSHNWERKYKTKKLAVDCPSQASVKIHDRGIIIAC